MATTLRVHSLAKELGVPSKAIIEKCRAEGIELKNHMAAISVGLAESIREWFSPGADETSVEQAATVDVERLREAARKQRKAEEQAAAEGAAAAPAEAEAPRPPEPVVETAPVGAPVVAEEAPETGAAVLAAQAAAPDAPPLLAEPGEAAQPAAVPVEPALAEPETPPGAGEAPPISPDDGALRPAARAEPPEPPKPVLPAGPKLVPKPAELRGPTVVRIEAPEPQRPVRPRPAAGRSVGLTPAASGSVTSAPPRKRGRKGTRAEEEELARAASRSPRRHGTAVDVDQRLQEWRDQDLLERKERLASVTGHGLRDRRAAERRRQAATDAATAPAVRKEPVSITTPITLRDLSSTLGLPFATISKKLLEHTGRLWMINQSIDENLLELLAIDLGLTIKVAKAKSAADLLREEYDDRERPNMRPRPPVVAMLGHVDHGKTSLLDAIRKTHVAAGEAGGITQHIGAYRIQREGWDVTFIDTPGHKAFTEMRARGAHLTDVVVLVVAADDGVMPQTVEAINHAKAAGVQIVVALNKIDLPGVDLNRVYAQLSEQGLTPTEWGGETDLIKTSATKGQGIDALLSHLSTLSELMDLRADATVPPKAMVIEAQMREGRGVVAQVLVQEGTLRVGQCVVCGPAAGRIRALRDDRGRPVTQATPGTPVEVSGLDELPAAGDLMLEVDSLTRAKEIAAETREMRRDEALRSAAPKPRTLESLVRGDGESETPELNVIVKADVQGSVEVLRRELGEFPADKARLRVLHAAVGAVSEADVHLARASGAVIIGFHVVAEDRARQLAEQLGVEIRAYRVIYEVLDDLRKALAGLLEPVRKEEIRGSAEVRQVFNVSRVGTIAGCLVTDGTIHRNHTVRVIRDGRVVIEGKSIDSLKRFKDDAREVRAGLECGLKVRDFDDVKPADIIQAYEVVEVAQEL